MIECKNLYFSYGQGQPLVIDNLNYVFEQGKNYFIEGDHGSGKTTLLKLLASVQTPYIQGVIQGDILHFITQDKIAYLSELTEDEFVFDNIQDELYARLYTLGYPASNIHTQIQLTLDYFQIQHLALKPISELSKGQKQYFKLIKVLSTKYYEFVIFDEAVSHLDLAYQSMIFQYLKKVQKEVQMTLVVVDHQALAWQTHFDFEVLTLKHQTNYNPWFSFKREDQIPQKPSSFSMTQAYENIAMLAHIMLWYKPSTIVQVQGSNGSGKTTLCKALMGMHEKDRFPNLTKKMLMDEPSVMFFKDYLQQEWKKDVQHPFGHYRTDALSRGQKKIEMFQYLIFSPPQLLILDEPMIGLNSTYQAYLSGMIQRLKAMGSMIILTTPTTVDIECDQIIEI